jgi:NADPH-dependent glutamate synthase beta subunit-like oxidoreductase
MQDDPTDEKTAVPTDAAASDAATGTAAASAAPAIETAGAPATATAHERVLAERDLSFGIGSGGHVGSREAYVAGTQGSPQTVDPALSFPLKDQGAPRQCILDLGQKITDRIGHKVCVDDPEYWGLACVVTDEMAEVANKMQVRHPLTMEQLVARTGHDEAYLEPLLFDMCKVGLLEYNWENPAHDKQWVLPMFVPGSAEFTNMNAAQLEAHPELARFFERMTFLPLEKVVPMVPPGGAGIGMHVIPVEQAIDAESHSADIEHLSYWLKKYDGRYSAGFCSCRKGRALMGEGSGDDPDEWCIGVGDMADYCVETGKGRYVTYDEVMDILRRAEENGFVHQITNIDGEDKIFAICNCNVNICNALRTSQLFNTPNLSRSAYVAKVDPEACVACAGCVEVCPAGAVKLGQKLCTKDGPMTYPVHELPDDTDWGPDKWDEDYRDTARNECYDTGTAPCKVACPAHLPVQGYLKMAAQGRFDEALTLIKWENPFPAVCGRVCNRPCEDACTRGSVDAPVAIDEVKKFIAQRDLDPATRCLLPKVVPSNKGSFPQKVAIVGAGPAGLSCAFYLAQKGYSPTVFEKSEIPGGMMQYGIPAYKLAKDVVAAEVDAVRDMGVDIRCGVEVGRDITLDQLRDEGYAAFYLAIGCQGSRDAGVAGEDAAGVEHAVDFLRDHAAGQDAPVEGDVVVIGGGNVAIDCARVSVHQGAAAVTMCCLEGRDEMPATEEEIAEALEDGVELDCGWGPAEVLTQDGHVVGIRLKRCTSVFDADGRFSPVYDESDTKEVRCSHVLMSIGQSIEWGDLLAGSAVELGRGNGPVADAVTYQTAQPDVFVGGDVFTGPRFAIDAIAAGHEAAISIHRFVQPGSSLTIGRNKRNYVELDKDSATLPIGSYDRGPRQVPGTRKVARPRLTFEETAEPFTAEQVAAETARCLGCGASVVDPNKCIGCGVCTTRCKFDAIHLTREHPEASTMVRTEDKMAAILPYAAKRQVKIIKRKLTGR